MAFRRWINYAYDEEAQGDLQTISPSRFEFDKGIFQQKKYDKYEKKRRSIIDRPFVNLQANEATLNCLRWLLMTRNVDMEIKSPPHFEEVEYASSDEDIWDTLQTKTKKKEPPKRKATGPTLKVNVTCEWQRCNAQFSDNVEYRKHIDGHFQELAKTTYKEYHCEWDLCDFKTDDIVMFERHVKHHEMHGRYLAAGEAVEFKNNVPKCNLGGLDRNRLPELLKDFECHWEECRASFRSLSLLYDHVVAHADMFYNMRDVSRKCEWRGCSFVGKDGSALRVHMKKSHANTVGFACRKCGATRKNPIPFLGHFLSQASVKDPDLCCRHCNQLFLKKNHLETHLRNFHQGFICDICHLKFLSRGQLRIHVANVHVKLRPFKCDECDKAFPTKNNLRAHKHVHNKQENGFQCSNCDHKVSTYLGLRKHNYLMHMGRNYPYECHLCGKQVKQAISMATHFRNTHHLPVPEGFHRYTYRLEDGMVFRLKTTKTYEPNKTGEDKPRMPKMTLPEPQPMDVQIKIEMQEEVALVKVDLQTIPVERAIKVESSEKNKNTPADSVVVHSDTRILTRAARRLLRAGKS